MHTSTAGTMSMPTVRNSSNFRNGLKQLPTSSNLIFPEVCSNLKIDYFQYAFYNVRSYKINKIYEKFKCLRIKNIYRLLVFWSQDPFTCLKITEGLEELFCLCRLYLPIIPCLKLKLNGLKTFIHNENLN